MNSLGNLEIIITRPRAQAEPWAAELVACGALVHVIPLLEILPLQNETHTRAIKNKILDLDHFHKIIFVSQNAVHFGMEWIDRYWPQLPTKVDFFAVGSTTAQVLEGFGVRAVNLAQDPMGAMTSEALLASPELQKVAHEKILIFRGLGGRGLMADLLRERGAQVEYCEVYERALPNDSAAAMRKLFESETEHQLRVVSVHSGESLENFVKIIRDWPNQSVNSAYNAGLVVPSERIAEMARSSGFQQILVAANATDSAMLSALLGAGQ